MRSFSGYHHGSGSSHRNFLRRNMLFCMILCVLGVSYMSQSVSANFVYGVHEPNGMAAVKYLYGPDGTWKTLSPAEYIWNYYNWPDNPPNHPFDKESLIGSADGTRFFTCRDANGHLLLDFNHDGEIDTTDGGFSFHEHNGHGHANAPRGRPFTNFWYDDNWLARYMTNAYGTPAPNGLSDYAAFTRWRIIGGDNAWFQAYPHAENYIDQLALNGMYYVTIGNIDMAQAAACRILELSAATWQDSYFIYPNMTTSYYMGLTRILFGLLVRSGRDQSGCGNVGGSIGQHFVDLRTLIISYQQADYRDGSLTSWVSDVHDPNSLINTESTVCNVLGLGINYNYVFENGYEKNIRLLPGNYTADIFLRPSRNARFGAAQGGAIQVVDSDGSVLASTVPNAMFKESVQFYKRHTLSFTVSNSKLSIETVASEHDLAFVGVTKAN